MARVPNVRINTSGASVMASSRRSNFQRKRTTHSFQFFSGPSVGNIKQLSRIALNCKIRLSIRQQGNVGRPGVF